MRVSRKKKIIATAFIIAITAAIYLVLPSSGSAKKAVSEIKRHRRVSYNVFQVLRRFGRLAKDKNITVCVIEPHILFSMISQKKQHRLSLRTSFNFSARSENVATVAVQGNSGWKLSQNTVKSGFEFAGFSHFVEKKKKNQERPHYINENERDLSAHHFYVRRRIIIHVVIFFHRSGYYWHKKLTNLPMEVAGKLARRNLYFSQSDSIYDRFLIAPMGANGSYPGLYVPDNIERFLFEVPTSQVVECRAQESTSVNNSQNASPDPVTPTEISVMAAHSVILEMKTIMDARMAPFWLASGTLLGWYRNCEIIPHTHDVDFGTWSSDLNGILEKDFREHDRLKLLCTLGQSGEDLEFWLLYGLLRVDLFFTYQNDDEFWVGGHNPEMGYSFRYLFPKFSLCSGDFLGHKVLVPCQVEEVLQAEYGSEWMTPVIKWNYEASARNIMGRRYWGEGDTYNFRKQMAALH